MKPESRETNLNDRLDRRRFIQGSAVTALTAAASCAGPGSDSGGPATAIELENRKPGTRDWQLTRVWVDRGSYRSAHVEGYCSHQSIEAGDTLSIFVSAEPARPFRVDIYRMGYYGGHGGRLMKTVGPLEGKPQPLPEIGPNRLRECRWEPSLEFKIPEDWTSGVYLGKLTTLPAGNQPYWQSYVIFIVRDRRPAHLLFQCSDNTWQAYNRWPDDYSLYTHPEGAHHPGVAASFDRPYAKFPMFADFPLSVGTGEFLLWEYPLCYWLEREGLDVTYCSNCDVLEPSFVTRCRRLRQRRTRRVLGSGPVPGHRDRHRGGAQRHLAQRQRRLHGQSFLPVLDRRPQPDHHPAPQLRPAPSRRGREIFGDPGSLRGGRPR